MQYRRYQVDWRSDDKTAAGVEEFVLHEGTKVEAYYIQPVTAKTSYHDLDLADSLRLKSDTPDSIWEGVVQALAWERLIGIYTIVGGIEILKITHVDTWEA